MVVNCGWRTSRLVFRLSTLVRKCADCLTDPLTEDSLKCLAHQVIARFQLRLNCFKSRIFCFCNWELKSRHLDTPTLDRDTALQLVTAAIKRATDNSLITLAKPSKEWHSYDTFARKFTPFAFEVLLLKFWINFSPDCLLRNIVGLLSKFAMNSVQFRKSE